MTPSGASGYLKKPFRIDINGLRSWAVALVLLYHFKVPPFAGGFIGVDVFFVISGYLMTSILLGESARQDSLQHFYLKRALRILPALATLCLLLMLCGWWFLSARDYLALARQVAWSLAGISNHLFWGEAGYFDTAAHDKWLLHTWSLSVEMQFYLVYPLILKVAHHLCGDHWWRMVMGLALMSFAACMAIGPVEPTMAFYSLPTRAWQLLAGAGIWLFGKDAPISARQAACLELTGVLVIVVAACFYSPTLTWPGAWTLLPVAGAAMVLVGGNACTPLTAHPLAQWIGTRSYSLYLWHWPVIVALHFLSIESQSKVTLAAIVLSLALSAASYQWIERLALRQGGKPLRGGRWIVMAMVPLSGAILVISSAGAPGRLPLEVDAASAEAGNRLIEGMRCDATNTNPWRVCQLGGHGISAVLVGDSHAQSVASAILQAAGGGDAGILVWTYPGCIPLFGAYMVPGVLRSGSQCRRFNDWVRDATARLAPEIPIVLVSRSSAYVHGDTEPGWQGHSRPAVHFGTMYETPDSKFGAEFTQAWVDTACYLARRRTVFLMRPVPEMPSDVPRAVSRSLAMGSQHFPQLSRLDYERRHSLVLAAQNAAQAQCGNVVILDPRAALCSADHCRSTEGVRPLYYDDDHMSEFGNKQLVPMFEAMFQINQ